MTGGQPAVSDRRSEALRRRTRSGPGTAHRSPLTAYPLIVAVVLAATMGGCGTPAKRTPSAPTAPGGYYLDDGPGRTRPADLDGIPEPVPRLEPLNRGTSQPYVVMGRRYVPMTALAPYKAHGIATWYGRRYHGKQTSSGEIYDMYAITAAHPTLPIPSYARVTNLQNGKSVVVRINDRGPFIEGRIIDLSYTAAHRIGLLAGGSARVEVESIVPGAAGTRAATPLARAPQPAAAQREARLVQPRAEGPPLPPPSAGAQVPVSADASGVYLQLGAFGSRENAESYIARLRTQMDWLAQTLHIFPRDGLFRVHAGPYADQGEARLIADRINQTLGVTPFVLTR
jgi:rare lipoprotein A